MMLSTDRVAIENVTVEGFDGLIPPVISKDDKVTEKPHHLFEENSSK